MFMQNRANWNIDYIPSNLIINWSHHSEHEIHSPAFSFSWCVLQVHPKLLITKKAPKRMALYSVLQFFNVRKCLIFDIEDFHSSNNWSKYYINQFICFTTRLVNSIFDVGIANDTFYLQWPINYCLFVCDV